MASKKKQLARLSPTLEFVAFTKWDGKKERQQRERRQMGKLGPASEVRRIDPADYVPQQKLR